MDSGLANARSALTRKMKQDSSGDIATINPNIQGQMMRQVAANNRGDRIAKARAAEEIISAEREIDAEIKRLVASGEITEEEGLILWKENIPPLRARRGEFERVGKGMQPAQARSSQVRNKQSEGIRNLAAELKRRPGFDQWRFDNVMRVLQETKAEWLGEEARIEAIRGLIGPAYERVKDEIRVAEIRKYEDERREAVAAMAPIPNRPAEITYETLPEGLKRDKGGVLRYATGNPWGKNAGARAPKKLLEKDNGKAQVPDQGESQEDAEGEPGSG